MSLKDFFPASHVLSMPSAWVGGQKSWLSFKREGCHFEDEFTKPHNIWLFAFLALWSALLEASHHDWIPLEEEGMGKK